VRILVGIDDDALFEPILAALRWCVRAERGDRALVLPPPQREPTDRALAGALALLRESGIEASTEVRRGRAAEEILHVAERYRPHVIVMGSRGLSGLRALVVGSVTQRLVRHGQASVLVARSPAQREHQ